MLAARALPYAGAAQDDLVKELYAALEARAHAVVNRQWVQCEILAVRILDLVLMLVDGPPFE